MKKELPSEYWGSPDCPPDRSGMGVVAWIIICMLILLVLFIAGLLSGCAAAPLQQPAPVASALMPPVPPATVAMKVAVRSVGESCCCSVDNHFGVAGKSDPSRRIHGNPEYRQLIAPAGSMVHSLDRNQRDSHFPDPISRRMVQRRECPD